MFMIQILSFRQDVLLKFEKEEIGGSRMLFGH